MIDHVIGFIERYGINAEIIELELSIDEFNLVTEYKALNEDALATTYSLTCMDSNYIAILCGSKMMDLKKLSSIIGCPPDLFKVKSINSCILFSDTIWSYKIIIDEICLHNRYILIPLNNYYLIMIKPEEFIRVFKPLINDISMEYVI